MKRKPGNHQPFNLLFWGFFCLLLLSSALTLYLGATPWRSLWQDTLLQFQGLSNDWNPLLDERLPRLIVLIVTGASLSIAGATMQALFHNPLASPSLLGISAGGSLCGMVVFIFNWHMIHPFILPLATFAGCLAALILVFMLARLQGHAIHSLILTGIALSTLLVAIQGVLLYALRDQWQLIQMLTEWEAGSTLDRQWQHVHMQFPLALVGISGCLYYREALNLLALGDDEATSLGVDVPVVRWRLSLCVALLVGGSLAALGLIAFFGLIIPHLLRRLQGANCSTLLWLCLVAGSAFLPFFDILIRFFQWDLSLGSLSALGGGLFFIILLFKTNRSQAYT